MGRKRDAEDERVRARADDRAEAVEDLLAGEETRSREARLVDGRRKEAGGRGRHCRLDAGVVAFVPRLPPCAACGGARGEDVRLRLRQLVTRAEAKRLVEAAAADGREH